MSNPSAIRSRTHVLFIAALILLLLAVSIKYTAKVLTPRKDGHTQSAILRWAKQFQQMQEGENIYAKFNYPNPPILPQMLTPIFELVEANPAVGALTWFYLKVGLVIVCLLWVFRLVETPGRPFPTWAKLVAVAVSINPVIGDLNHGNVNIFILFLVMATLYSFARGRDLLSGLLLALAVACKVTPALFLVYFAWKRAWRVVIAAGCGLVLSFLILPSLYFAVQKGSLVDGWEQNWAALTAWEHGMIEPYLFRGEVTSERENQSLPGVLTRLLSHEPSFSKWIENVDTPLAYHNASNMDREAVKRIVQACQLGFLLLMVYVCRAPIRATGVPKTDVRQGWRLAAEYSLILVGMLMFSERTWKHHCVTLVLPFAVICYGAFADGFSKRVRFVTRASLVVAAIAILLPTAAEVFGDWTLTSAVGELAPDAQDTLKLNPNSPRELAQVYGAYLWAMLALLVGLSSMLLSRSDRQASFKTM
jgi:alpha-1,2-mannosyltransferase